MKYNLNQEVILHGGREGRIIGINLWSAFPYTVADDETRKIIGMFSDSEIKEIQEEGKKENPFNKDVNNDEYITAEIELNLFDDSIIIGKETEKWIPRNKIKVKAVLCEVESFHPKMKRFVIGKKKNKFIAINDCSTLEELNSKISDLKIHNNSNLLFNSLWHNATPIKKENVVIINNVKILESEILKAGYVRKKEN